MGIPVMVLGESGTGKSASLRNVAPDEIGVVNVCLSLIHICLAHLETINRPARLSVVWQQEHQAK